MKTGDADKTIRPVRPEDEVVGVVGLGYVGLPLAVTFARRVRVYGYDACQDRVSDLSRGFDRRGEIPRVDLLQAGLEFCADIDGLRHCSTLVVAVPTPVSGSNSPDLSALKVASQKVGGILQPGMMVVYESTVYPGVTEEICLPILEDVSGLRLGQFDLAYSPERINPGDRTHTLESVVKIVSGHDGRALERCAALYGLVVKAGIHRARNIKTAEAAKVIENVQRDLNIALMNELACIFSRMGLRTREVLDAAATKWNFHRYHPGLVGGHCIGVDPYYLTHKAMLLGYHPEVILAGRRINDSMAHYVGEMTVRAMNNAGILPRDARVLLLGFSFKEDVGDMRNSKAVDLAEYLRDFGCQIMVCEPLVDAEEVRRIYGVEPVVLEELPQSDAVILVNAHAAFAHIREEDLIHRTGAKVVVDIKNRFSEEMIIQAGAWYVSL
ncbi:MAG TPA: nucleotide sugar dehydrogenase [Kiritimatiellae bacterium]|nr:nucleotide sugar dehydrogenase [Kiritimatiellia bacterium]